MRGMWDAMVPTSGRVPRGGRTFGHGSRGSDEALRGSDEEAVAIVRRSSTLGTRALEAAELVRGALMHGWNRDIYKAGRTSREFDAA